MSRDTDAFNERPRSRREQGSAYLITLMSLFLLTILGLSVSLVTQTEVILSSQDRQIERTFYDAESGIDLSVGRALASGDFSSVVQIRERSELEQGELMTVRDRVQSSPLFCLGDSPCHLCSINQGRTYVRRNHVLSVNAERIAPGSEDVVLARKSLATMVDAEPQERLVGCIADLPEAGGSFLFDEF
jgi:hypothetical protein